MRRRDGTGLVSNELRLLLTAIDLHSTGRDWFHGYDLARHFADSEDTASIMSQPTLYRALRRLEARGALTSQWESLEAAASHGREGRPRRYYSITSTGAELAVSELGTRRLQWRKGRLLPQSTG